MQTLVKVLDSRNAPQIECRTALNAALAVLQTGQVTAGLNDLFDALRASREVEPATWLERARACLHHPICDLLHQDPFTFRAFSKPRGYAGDAVMMDYIYGLGEARYAARDATPIGRAIFQYMRTRPAARAVRYRRQFVAELIDRTVSRGGSRVMALAAGHLREVEMSSAVRTGKLHDFVALDQDEASLAVVDREYGRLGVKTMNVSLRQLLCGKACPTGFDFVYAAGLFDYLNAPAASALTCRMLEMARPGGLILIPNFLAGARDSGYMEAFMDWYLIYRNHADMRALTVGLSSRAIAEYDIFDDDDKTITFLLLVKAG